MRNSFFILLLIAGLISCKKENSSGFVTDTDLQINDTTWSNSLTIQSLAKTITTDLSLPVLADTLMITNVGIDDDDKIFNSDNYRVSIPKNCLINSITNRPYNYGPVTIKLLALDSNGDYIRNFSSTYLYNRPNQSVGFYNVCIYANDTLLSIKSGNAVHLFIKDSLINPAPQNVKLYKGNGYDITDDNFTWSQDSSLPNNLNFWYVSGPGPNKHVNGYDVSLTKLGWISLLAQANSPIPNNTKINVDLPVNFTNKNTFVYVIQNGTKNITRLTPELSSRTFAITNLPFNQNITIVTISKIDHKYYLGYSNSSYSLNQSIFHIVPQQYTIANIIDYLNTL